jgi:TPR repeat protein
MNKPNPAVRAGAAPRAESAAPRPNFHVRSVPEALFPIVLAAALLLAAAGPTAGMEPFDVPAVRRAAENGDADAQYKLGSAYVSGMFGVEKDHAMTLKWFGKAAAQGHVEAQYELGDCYYYGFYGAPINNAKAFSWYGKAARQGHVDSQYSLGKLYYIGEGTRENRAKAFEWFLKAAEQGHYEAQYVVAIQYLDGDGVKPDRGEVAAGVRRPGFWGSDQQAQRA